MRRFALNVSPKFLAMDCLALDRIAFVGRSKSQVKKVTPGHLRRHGVPNHTLQLCLWNWCSRRARTDLHVALEHKYSPTLSSCPSQMMLLLRYSFWLAPYVQMFSRPFWLRLDHCSNHALTKPFHVADPFTLPNLLVSHVADHKSTTEDLAHYP